MSPKIAHSLVVGLTGFLLQIAAHSEGVMLSTTADAAGTYDSATVRYQALRCCPMARFSFPAPVGCAASPLSLYPSGSASPPMTANADGDPHDNESEYFFGTDPTAPDLQPLLKLIPVGEEPSIEFTALKAEGPGYEGLTRRYTVQTCDDLQDWLPMPEADQLVGLNQSVLIELPAALGP